MEIEFSILRQARKNILTAVETLTIEQLKYIPEKFNNNIIWNIGHILATQQVLCYKLAEVEMYTSETLINKYKKGSKPTELITLDEVDEIKKQFIENSALMESDFKKGVFQKYNAYTTSFGYELKDINAAITFNNVHEGLHFGYILALKHCL